MFEIVKKEELIANFGAEMFNPANMICICRSFVTDAFDISIWKTKFTDVYHIMITNFKRGYFEVNTYNMKVSVQKRWDTGESEDLKKCPAWIQKILENNLF